MGEWEKRKGDKGNGERPINRGSVELTGGWQILGGRIEKKGQKGKSEKKGGRTRENKKEEKKTKHKSLPLEV